MGCISQLYGSKKSIDSARVTRDLCSEPRYSLLLAKSPLNLVQICPPVPFWYVCSLAQCGLKLCVLFEKEFDTLLALWSNLLKSNLLRSLRSSNSQCFNLCQSTLEIQQSFNQSLVLRLRPSAIIQSLNKGFDQTYRWDEIAHGESKRWSRHCTRCFVRTPHLRLKAVWKIDGSGSGVVGLWRLTGQLWPKVTVNCAHHFMANRRVRMLRRSYWNETWETFCTAHTSQ